VLPQFHGPELCRDAEGARNYDDDPLNYHGKLKVRIALQTMQAMRMNRPHFPEYTLPILCMHGTKDVTTSLAAAEAFVQVERIVSLLAEQSLFHSSHPLVCRLSHPRRAAAGAVSGGEQRRRDAAEAGPAGASAVHGARA
jgi:hypothetical protein